MLKYLFIIVCCVCVTIVLSQAATAVFLWQRGMLTREQLHEIRLILSQTGSELRNEDEDPQQAPKTPTVQEVAEARAMSVFNLDKRESELVTLKEIVDQKRSELESSQQKFSAQRKAFEDELKQLEESVSGAATEQARGILIALPAKEAVRHLMQLSLEEDVVLLKGMTEKTAARILKEFGTTATGGASPAAGPTGSDTPGERSRKIFEALSRGEPKTALVRRAQEDSAAIKGNPTE